MSKITVEDTKTYLHTDTENIFGYHNYIMDYKAICPVCNIEYKHYSGWINYTVDGLVFCSWTCKCKYLREHPLDPNGKERNAKQSNTIGVTSFSNKYNKDGTKKSWATKQDILYRLYELLPDVPKKELYNKSLPTLKALLDSLTK